MIRPLRNDAGSVLVTAIILMTVMLTMGLALMALIDEQTTQSRVERERESALQLNEGVLYSQAFVLADKWPGAGSTAADYFPEQCTSSGADAKCPTASTLAIANGGSQAGSNFTAIDFSADAEWTTRVRDNGIITSTGKDTKALYYPAQAHLAQTGCPVTPCTLDANNDRQLWVQVDAVVRGRPRSVVALLQLEEFAEAFPRNAVTAGSVAVTNSGNHGGAALLDISGSQIAVRCNPPADTASSGNPCLDYQRPTHIQPRRFVRTSQPNALSASAIARLRDVAEDNGTLFNGCPPNNADLSGAVVFVDNCSSASFGSSLQSVPCPANPQISSNGGCINTPDSPGILIWNGGSLAFTGNQTFVGLLYHTNPANSSSTVLKLGGGFQVYGAVAVDGPGRLEVGSNAEPNIRFNENVFNGLSSFGTAGLVQNTWRELPPGS